MIANVKMKVAMVENN